MAGNGDEAIDPEVADSWTPLQVAQRWMERVTGMLTTTPHCRGGARSLGEKPFVASPKPPQPF
jgi:hypothetical protein